MYPNLTQDLSCTEERMRIGGGVWAKVDVLPFYHPLHFMFDFYKGLT